METRSVGLVRGGRWYPPGRMCLHHLLARASRWAGLPRRRVVALLGVLAASALARARAAEAAGSYAGPLVDAHAHLKDGVGPDPAGLLALHDRVGIQGALLFGEPWPIATADARPGPGRIVPLLAEGYANALHPDSSYVHPDGLAQVFAANVVRGLGEVICRHSAFQLGAAGGFYRAPQNDVPADHPSLVEAYRQAGSYGAVVTIHQEWWFADELERAVRVSPRHAVHLGARRARRSGCWRGGCWSATRTCTPISRRARRGSGRARC